MKSPRRKKGYNNPISSGTDFSIRKNGYNNTPHLGSLKRNKDTISKMTTPKTITHNDQIVSKNMSLRDSGMASNTQLGDDDDLSFLDNQRQNAN